MLSKSITDRIKYWINKDISLADNDLRLISVIHFEQLKALGYDPKIMSGFELLKLKAEGRLYSPETIRRNRQKLQEKHPEYRGDKYKERHKVARVVSAEMVRN